MTNPLLIGADVHRDTNTICFMDRQGREVAPLKGFHLMCLVTCRDTAKPGALACNCAGAPSTRRPIERGCNARRDEPHHQSMGDSRA